MLPAPRSLAPVPVAEQELFAYLVNAASWLSKQGLTVTVDNLLDQVPEAGRTFVVDVFGSELFRSAMHERGVSLNPKARLSSHQHAALAIYMDTSARLSHRAKLSAAGVSQRQWDGWMLQPAFAAALEEVAEGRLRDTIPLAHQRLAEKVDDGDLPSIKYLNEITGRYNPNVQVELRPILLEFFRILDEERVPSDVMDRIGARAAEMLAGAPKPARAMIASSDASRED